MLCMRGPCDSDSAKIAMCIASLQCFGEVLYKFYFPLLLRDSKGAINILHDFKLGRFERMFVRHENAINDKLFVQLTLYNILR